MGFELDVVLAAWTMSAVLTSLLARKLNKVLTLGLLLGGFIALLIPVPKLSAAAYLVSYLSGFSVSSAVLATAAVLALLNNQQASYQSQKTPILLAMALWALVFYPLSLGAAALDPYAWGYGGNYVVSAVLLALGVLAILKGYYLACVVIIAGQLVYAANALVSDNLWDYLLDPMLAIYALFYSLKRLLCKSAA